MRIFQYIIISTLFLNVFSSCIGLKPTISEANQLKIAEQSVFNYEPVSVFNEKSVFAKRVTNKNVQFIKITVRNNQTVPITITEDSFDVFTNLDEVKWYDRKKCYRKLNNSYTLPGMLFLAGLATTPVHKTDYDEFGIENGSSLSFENSPYTYGLYSLAFTSLAAAVYGNINLYRELNKNYLYGKTVLPGETLTGYIAVKATPNSEILMRVKQ